MNGIDNITMIASGKGGVGKSSLTVCIGRELARLGETVLLVEMEPGLGVFDLLMGLERGVLCLSDFLEDRCSGKECALPDPKVPGLWAILAPMESGFLYDPLVFAKKMDELARDFDRILIETPPGFASPFQAAAKAARRAVIIATPDQPSLRDGRAVSDRLDLLGVKEQRLVLNRLDERFFKKRRPIPHLDFAIDTVGAQLLGVVPEDRELPYDILEYNGFLAYGKGRAACRNIAQRMMGQWVALGKL